MKSKKFIISLVIFVLILISGMGCTSKKPQDATESNIKVEKELSTQSTAQENEPSKETASETEEIPMQESESVLENETVETMEVEELEEIELDEGEATVGM